MRIDVHHHFPDNHEAGHLAEIRKTLAAISVSITTQGKAMSEALDRLQREVQETKDAADAAVARVEAKLADLRGQVAAGAAAIADLTQQLRDAQSDPVAVGAAADALDAVQAELAGVAADPAPAPEPAPEPAPAEPPADSGDATA